MRINNKLLLIIITLLALVLRFYKLDSIPALNADEAALGYNAYSLLETGKDEHGNPWPIHFQSFNDFKPGLTVYLIMPMVKLLGLNVMAVRFLPALLGALSPLVLYFFVKEVAKRAVIRKMELFALTSALFLAISPWHIHFSRGAWEVNVATFFMVLGSWLFLRAGNNPKNYIVSAVVFVLSLYTYHSARLIVPLLVLGLMFYERNNIRLNKKPFLVSGVVGILVLIPLLLTMFGAAGVSRASGVSIFADSGPINRINDQRGEHADPNSIISKVFHNKAVNYGLLFANNWLEHYWGEFLFLSGDDIQRNKVPETGQMYMVDALFIALGLYFIAKRPKGFEIILWWLIIAPAAAAITFQSPHALRSANMAVPLVVISAFGMKKLIDLIHRIDGAIIRITCYILLITLISWSLSRYLLMYYGHMIKEYPFSSQYGVEELVAFVKDREEEKVIVTDRYDQPYILFLFYLKYPPAKFQSEHTLTERDVYGFSTVRSFGKYEFRSIKYDEDRPLYPNSLLVGTDGEIPDEANIIKEIQFPNVSPAFQIVQN